MTVAAALGLVVVVLAGAYLAVPEFRAATAPIIGLGDHTPDITPSPPPSDTPRARATPTPVPTVEPTSRPTALPTVAPRTAPAVIALNVGFAGDFSGSVARREDYGPGNACEYEAKPEGGDLVTFVTVTTTTGPGGPSIQILFSDDDGPGPANPSILVMVNGVAYQWDRDSNVQYEGDEGGQITYFADGLGMEFDLDLHKQGDSFTRVRMIGTIECPPNPFAGVDGS